MQIIYVLIFLKMIYERLLCRLKLLRKSLEFLYKQIVSKQFPFLNGPLIL